MAKENVFNLPEDVVASLLTVWLSFHHVSCLDNAQCCRASRPKYLTALRSEAASFDLIGCKKAKDESARLKWIAVRKIKLKSIDIPTVMDPNLTDVVLQNSWPTIECLSLGDVYSAVVTLHQQPLVQFPRLRHLRVCWCDANKSLELCRLLASCADSLEKLSLFHSTDMVQLPVSYTMKKLNTLLLPTPIKQHKTAAVECELLRHCPNLVRLFVPSGHCDAALLSTISSHCPMLEQLHISLANRSSMLLPMQALLTVLQSCRKLRTLEIITGCMLDLNNIPGLNTVTFAEHCTHLTAFKVGNITSAMFILLLPGLCNAQHLAIGSLSAGSPELLHSLAQHCRQLRTLQLSHYYSQAPADAILAVCENLASIEELCWYCATHCWVTDEVLGALSVRCRKLKFLNLSGPSEDKPAYTCAGVLTLLEGCPALTKVHLRGVCSVPGELRGRYPHIEFRDESLELCSYWKLRGNSSTFNYFGAS